MVEEHTCPNCGSTDIVKNGHNRCGNQNYKCRDCGRQFVENPGWQPKSSETRHLIDLLLLERISLAGIARTLGLSMSWLQRYVNRHYQRLTPVVEVIPKAAGKLRVQMDELWSFVDNKGNKQWVWLALDRDTREIVGCAIGDRSRDSARVLWASMPAIYRQCAQVFTDAWEAYETVIPAKRHRIVGKETGLTSYIERFNNTLRQRVSRLVRKTLSFSKKQENHVGAIWNFIHDYNRSIRKRLLLNGTPPIPFSTSLS
jgi:insertion element IS1 protein InsB